jgi:hypothetical protein
MAAQKKDHPETPLWKSRWKFLMSVVLVGGIGFFIGRFLVQRQSVSPSNDFGGKSLTRSAEVPELPFPDNPDPDQCGIPIEWGADNQAWLNGTYQGELIEPVVHLYESHLRLDVQAQAPHGTEVEVILYQSNPVLDYYFVKIKGMEGKGSDGWIPALLLSFQPVD